jgi:hypothetical protein
LQQGNHWGPEISVKHRPGERCPQGLKPLAWGSRVPWGGKPPHPPPKPGA